jgi:hypothetical protein
MPAASGRPPADPRTRRRRATVCLVLGAVLAAGLLVFIGTYNENLGTAVFPFPRDEIPFVGLLVLPPTLLALHGWTRRRQLRKSDAMASRGRRLARAVVLLAVSAAITFAAVLAAWAASFWLAERRNWSRAEAMQFSGAYHDYFMFASDAQDWWIKEDVVLGVAPLERHKSEARDRFDDLKFAEASRAQEASSLKYYLQDSLAQGRHRAEAGALFEERAYQEALREPTASSMRGYLSDLDGLKLEGKHRAEAEARLDDLAYQEALKAQTAAALRAYRKEMAKGRHQAEAGEALRALYQEARKRYMAQAEGSDPQAIAGMNAILTALAEKDEPRVPLCFLPVAGLDGDSIERAIANVTGSTRVQPVGPAFTAEKNTARQQELTNVMRAALAKLVGADLMDLQPGTIDEAGPRFLVRYKVKASGSIYSPESQKGLPLKERTIYPGIEIDMDFTAQVPGPELTPENDPEKGYRYFIAAQPAPDFEVWTTEGQEPQAEAVYDQMGATAFQDFEERLLGAYAKAFWAEEQKHRLYQASMGLRGDDLGLIRQLDPKLGLFTPDGKPTEAFQTFAVEHNVWAAQNTAFIEEMRAPEKARAYVKAHL